jgi:hypothetical protein
VWYFLFFILFHRNKDSIAPLPRHLLSN